MVRIRLILAALCGSLGLIPQCSWGDDDIFRKNRFHVVQIAFAGRNGTEIGSGVIISPAGHILTAAHVIGRKKGRDPESGEITIKMLNDRGIAVTYAGKVDIEKDDTNLDLAILLLSGDIFPYAELAMKDLTDMPPTTTILWNASMPRPFPYSGQLSVRDGGKWTLQMATLGSDSGSPVFDPSGKVVAILTNQFSEGDKRYALATPMLVAQEFLPIMTEPERGACMKQERDLRLQAKPVQKEGRVDCDGKKPTDPKRVELPVPAGHALAGLVTHEDDTDGRYGRVEAVEYEDTDGLITVAKVTLYCRKVNMDSGEQGWAKTTIRGSIRAILTEADEEDIKRRCFVRRQ